MTSEDIDKNLKDLIEKINLNLGSFLEQINSLSVNQL